MIDDFVIKSLHNILLNNAVLTAKIGKGRVVPHGYAAERHPRHPLVTLEIMGTESPGALSAGIVDIWMGIHSVESSAHCGEILELITGNDETGSDAVSPILDGIAYTRGSKVLIPHFLLITRRDVIGYFGDDARSIHRLLSRWDVDIQDS